MIFRTKIKGIAIEFELPVNPNGSAIIICDGFPTIPQKKTLINQLSQKGFAVFYPRYSGSWESDGFFLLNNPIEAIDVVIEIIETGVIRELYHDTDHDIGFVKNIVVMGGSFGGSVALGCMGHQKIQKIVSISPVIDYSRMTKTGDGQDLENVKRFVDSAYGLCYRIDESGWNNLLQNKIFGLHDTGVNLPNNQKILLIASPYDSSVPIGPIRELRARIGSSAELLTPELHGHLSLGNTPENVMKYISHWVKNEDVEYTKKYLLDLLTKKIKSEIGDTLDSLIVYGSIQKSETLEKVSDIDCVIILKEPIHNQLQKLRTIFKDFPYKIQCKVFTRQELKEIEKNPTQLYLHTTGTIMLPILASATVLVGTNPFVDIPVSLHEIRISVIQKIEQYLSRIKALYISEIILDRDMDLWKKKTEFIVYDTSIVLFRADPSKLNADINFSETFAQFDTASQAKFKFLQEDMRSRFEYLELCAEALEHCSALLKV